MLYLLQAMKRHTRAVLERSVYGGQTSRPSKF